ncbi:hypothetical protein ACJRO7_011209 [Eucalyptus globulus]|uniref:Uncharacterized protein n=1 Tax=Eucalyptus globulus TaxID=34317 RepID=A0ABD3LHT6_EUCGL
MREERDGAVNTRAAAKDGRRSGGGVVLLWGSMLMRVRSPMTVAGVVRGPPERCERGQNPREHSVTELSGRGRTLRNARRREERSVTSLLLVSLFGGQG